MKISVPPAKIMGWFTPAKPATRTMKPTLRVSQMSQRMAGFGFLESEAMSRGSKPKITCERIPSVMKCTRTQRNAGKAPIKFTLTSDASAAMNMATNVNNKVVRRYGIGILFSLCRTSRRFEA
ncbi:MAG: hypothetical protein IPP66_00125 [Anaerolineales bacterium]|nr:hypothetical protein [Anaerolineales bacterium]